MTTAQAQDDDAELANDLRYIAAHTNDPRDEEIIYKAADRLEALARLSVTTPDTTVLVERAKALVAKLDECESHITAAFMIRFPRLGQYTGPQYGEALEALRAALASTANPTGETR